MDGKNLKRILAIHDISCFGKCSLTVALPIVSAAGLECTILPNALLSAHTGIKGFTYLDLTDQMRPILAHWKELELKFDSIFTGFLCNREQIDIVCEVIDSMRDEGTLVFVDPAMADNGELYSVFGSDFPSYMRRLCSKADVIKPNITEACLLVGRKYVPGPYSHEWIDSLLSDLSALGPKHIVLTGVSYDASNIGAMAYDCITGEKQYYSTEKVPGYYVGTGDIFSSVVVSAMNRGESFFRSVELAVEFTTGCIRRTYDAGTDIEYGVDFESGIPDLIRKLDG